MQIELIVIGTLKERFWQAACGEYLKRLQPFAKIQVTELKEYRMSDKAITEAGIRQALDKEAEQILKRIKPTDIVMALAIEGHMYTSEAFAQKINTFKGRGKKLVFVIGSSHGLSQSIIARANDTLSFSPMTFPHQLARVLLLEQVYRSFKILANHSYHK